MGLLSWFRRDNPEAAGGVRPQASGGQYFSGLDDPALLEFIRSGGGGETASGAYVNSTTALRNMAVLRCLSLISQTIGMLPLNLLEAGPDRRKAVEHPVYKLLRRRPNPWQTPSQFKAHMELKKLQHGTAYARIVRSMGRPIQLLPLDPACVEPRQRNDWSLEYVYTRKDGGQTIIAPEDMFQLPDLSDDGISGLSRTKLAKEAIGLALQAELAAARLFKNGMMVGGAFKHPEKLSETAYKRLQESLAERYSGAANAQKWMILEEGMETDKFAQTAVDSQHIENRNHQIEEVARAYGVPRPLLMMDDTSWGSGVEQLGIFFVQYTLAPSFTAWEEEVARSLLADDEQERFYAKYNERALLRGTLKDQADFFAKALGSGGHSSWLTVNEVRDLSDMPSKAGADDLAPAANQRTPSNEPTQTS